MPVGLLAASASGSSKTTVVVIDIAVSVAVLVLILYRQLQVRRASPRMTLPVVLMILGVVSLVGAGSTGSGRLTGDEAGVLVALLLLDAGGLGAVRAWTVKLWRDGPDVLRQGTWLTVVLWLVGLAIHEGVDFAAHIPASSTLLYLGVTLLAQQLALQTRINRMEQQPANPVWAAPPAPPLGPAGPADGQGPVGPVGKAGTGGP